MKLSDWLPSVFVEGDGDDIQVSTKKFSQFPTTSGEGVQGVGIKDGNNVKFDLTTDSISVNPNTFRNEKGQFIGTPEELEALKNQRDVNEFFYNAINDIEQGDIDLEGYATEEYVDNAIDGIEIPSIDGLATEGYVDSAIDAIEFPETDLSGVVSKTGGDEMEGPLNVKGHSGDSRGTSRIKTLGVFSESGSALRLGTTTDRVYIEDENTKFNGGVLVNNIGPKTEDGRGITLNVEGSNAKHLITKSYVDAADAELQSKIDAIDIPDIPDIPDLSDYVSAVDGDQTMKGPLTISGLGTWKGSRIKLDYVTAHSDTGTVVLGTPSNEQNLRVYDNKVQVTDVPFWVKTISGFANGYGTSYVGAYEEPDHIATKKDVEAAVAEGGGGGADLSGLVQKSGDTMTGTLEVPRFDVKQSDGEAACLIEGKVDGTVSSARLTFSNKINSYAYGNLEWHGNSGSGWFQFNKDVDFSAKGLHSVDHIRMSGAKGIQEAQSTRIKLDGKVVIPKTGDSNKDGFVIKGKTDEGNNGDLLTVYHNSNGLDAVSYFGRQTGGSNLATVGYVKENTFTPGDQVAKTDGESANVGGFWISSGALYVKVS